MQISITTTKTLVSAVVFAMFSVVATSTWAEKCLYVSSYHKGYEWSDGIERGIDSKLQGKCEVDKFYMDTKRNKGKEFGQMMGNKAKAHIEKTQPDVVIACDDNASRYIVKPYFKDSKTPFVFCGVNHNADAYGYPYSNVTGMIEIAPVKPLLKVVKKTVEGARRGIYLSVDVHSQHKEYGLNKRIYEESGIQLDRILVTNMDEWVTGFKKAQKEADFVIIGSNGGLNGWDDKRAHAVAQKHTQVFTVTNMEWMVKFSMLAMTKVAEEQGEWAATLALDILSGTKPTDLPIVANRKWNILVNPKLLAVGEVKLPQHVMRKAVKVDS